MKTKMILMAGLVFVFLVTLLCTAAYAVEKDEFTEAYKETYNELLKEDPELARAFKEETGQAIASGEVSLESTDVERKVPEETKAAYEDLKTAIQGHDAYRGNDVPKVEGDKMGISKEQAQKLEQAMKEGNWEVAESMFKELGLDKKFEGPGDLGRPEFVGGEFEHSKMTPERAIEEFNRELSAGRMDMFNEQEIAGMREAMGRGDMEAAGKIGQEAGEAHYREMGPEQMAKEFQERTGQEFTKEMDDRAREWIQERDSQEQRQENFDLPRPPEPPQPMP